jgi:hypothetical protein
MPSSFKMNPSIGPGPLSHASWTSAQQILKNLVSQSICACLNLQNVTRGANQAAWAGQHF